MSFLLHGQDFGLIKISTQSHPLNFDEYGNVNDDDDNDDDEDDDNDDDDDDGNMLMGSGWSESHDNNLRP